MSQRKKHLSCLDKPFNVDLVRKLMTDKELETLKNYGCWMEALVSGKLKPLTKDQEVFIESMKSVNPPKRKIFNVYWRYIKRKEIVKSQKLNDNKPLIKDDRADWKKIRRSRY